ncbi:MAG: pyruvate ferredoxin oxidoreductase [Elusimicrobia bacterium]|nr:pyruvate ferredoxin oxidoreductase [Elusimicrobiota bacterium]
MKKVLMGNHAAALGAALARVDVAAAYPITPQTQSVELLAELAAKGDFKGRFVLADSEHSAMSILLGAASVGARTFTSTSSHGLAYMHELLHWVAGARLPVVMVEVNRALAAPWNLWTDQTDSLSQRDTGWMQFYCATSQEVLDTVLQAYRVAERVRLPAMVVLDGFTLSHTYEPVDVPSQAAADAFLPPYQPPDILDPARPISLGGLTMPKEYFRLRRRIDHDMRRALGEIAAAGRDFQTQFGRGCGLVEDYRCEDAATILVTAGAVGSTAQEAVDSLRAEGLRAGCLRLRVFRPFPTQALRACLPPRARLAVVDRSYSPGASGIFFQEIKAALYPSRREIAGYVAGLGGGDITVEFLRDIWRDADAGRAVADDPAWVEDAR